MTAPLPCKTICVWRELSSGRIKANVPRRVITSKTGWACGPGLPAVAGGLDLALNILEALVPPGGIRVPCLGGTSASLTAWNLREAFHRDFLIALGGEGGKIPVARIVQWIKDQKRDGGSRVPPSPPASAGQLLDQGPR